MEHIKWTERKFYFGYDRRYIPLFIERLNATAPRIEELLQGINDATASDNRNDEWSIKEHIGHLSDLEHLHAGRIDDFIDGVSVLRPADMNNEATYEAGHNSISVIKHIAVFRQVRASFINRILALEEPILDRKAQHPRLQQMVTIPDILYFIAEHDTHHLMRIAHILKPKQF